MTFSIPFHHVGGSGPLLHYAHPNGYTPLVFKQFLQPLIPHFQVTAVCHRPLWPGSQPEEMTNWHLIADDLMDLFEQQQWEGVIGVGHSLGAVVTMYAAVKRPSLFRALVLIDPVFLVPAWLEVVAANPAVTADTPLVQNALRRRHRWATRQAAFDRFRNKEAFQTWSDTVLWDYVNEGLRQDETGEYVLTYSREWEAQFYSQPPTDVWQYIPQITQPTLAIRGAHSDTLFPDSWQRWQQQQPQATFVEIEGAGHMVTAERPILVAEHILQFTASL